MGCSRGIRFMMQFTMSNISVALHSLLYSASGLLWKLHTTSRKYNCNAREIRMSQKLSKFPASGTLWCCLMEHLIYAVASKCYQIQFNCEKYNTVNHFSIISFTIVPLCKYALVPASINVLETFLTAIYASLFMSSDAPYLCW
jgi:hypothetical protein